VTPGKKRKRRKAQATDHHVMETDYVRGSPYWYLSRRRADMQNAEPIADLPQQVLAVM
jgi:hypothetical protein